MKLDSRLARLDRSHPENAGVLALLGARGGSAEWIARPSSVPDPFQGAGAHPDVVEWVWGELGRNLPRAARALVLGVPALVHPSAGLVLAVALGTTYALRLPQPRLAEAAARGLVPVRTFQTQGETLDLACFGPGWRFGAWSALEREWLEEESARLAGG